MISTLLGSANKKLKCKILDGPNEDVTQSDSRTICIANPETVITIPNWSSYDLKGMPDFCMIRNTTKLGKLYLNWKTLKTV